MIQTGNFDVNQVEGKSTLLFAACMTGHEQMVRLLVDTYKADVNDSSNQLTGGGGVKSGYEEIRGCTSLLIAAEHGYLNIVKFLLESRADLQAKTKDQCTVAHIACRGGSLEVLEYLCAYINNGQLMVNDKNVDGNTPLHEVAASGCKDDEEALIFVLKNWKPNVDAQNNEGASALHIVASKGEHSRSKTLIQHGARVDIRDQGGQTPIHYATKSTYFNDLQRIEIIKELIARGANINDRDNLGRTPLHLAVYKDRKTIDALINLHADINITDNNGRTPYHMACIYQYPELLDALERANANPILKDNLGFLPQDYKKMSAADRLKYAYPDVNYQYVH